MKDRLFGASLVLLTLLLVVSGLQSLEWRPVHDSPLYLYSAQLIDSYGFVPYRDFFDWQMPVTHLVNLLLIKVFGHGDLAFRCADLLLLAFFLATTVLWMRHLDPRAALLGAVVFGLNYLRYGQVMSMQREFLALLPVGLALVILFSPGRKTGLAGSVAVGFLFGITAGIKPHIVLGLPLLIAYQLFEVRDRED
ncbi:hypothetical protein ACFL4G_09810, partial [Thermodesulfobacteriota bacterium]